MRLNFADKNFDLNYVKKKVYDIIRSGSKLKNMKRKMTEVHKGVMCLRMHKLVFY